MKTILDIYHHFKDMVFCKKPTILFFIWLCKFKITQFIISTTLPVLPHDINLIFIEKQIYFKLLNYFSTQQNSKKKEASSMAYYFIKFHGYCKSIKKHDVNSQSILFEQTVN